MPPAHLHEREPLALELESQLEARAHVDGLEELHLLLEGQVGRVADVSASAPGSEIERTKAAMRPSSPRSSRISSTTARYSRFELADAAVGGLLVRPLLDVDEEAALCVAGRGAGDAAVQAVQRDRATAAGGECDR